MPDRVERGWKWAAGRVARTPIRVKLVTAVLALVAIALAVISFAGIGFLRSYLIRQAGQELAASGAPSLVRSYAEGTQPSFNDHGQLVGGRAGGQPVGSDTGFLAGWLPPGGHLQWLYLEPSGVVNTPDGPQLSPHLRPAPTISPSAGWLADGGQATADAPGHGHYLLQAYPGLPVDAVNGRVTGTIVVGLDIGPVYSTIGRLTRIDLALSGALLIGIGVAGVALIRASLRPLTDIEKTAQAIASGELSRRVPERDPRTEIGRLGRSLNAMLAQIEAAFAARSASESAARRSEDRMRQFIADASHELRTPLTAIRGFAEYYRQRGGVDLAGARTLRLTPGQGALPQGGAGGGAGGLARNGAVPEAGSGTGPLAPADLDRIMRRVEQESSRMGILVEDLLLLARLDQQRPLNRDLVDLLTLSADAVHDARVVAPGRNIHLTVSGSKAPLVVGDEVRLRQVIGNLMSNAMAHTPDGTPIDVVLRTGSLDEAGSGGPFVTSAPGLPERAPAPTAWPVALGEPTGGESLEQADVVGHGADGPMPGAGMPVGLPSGLPGGQAGWRPGAQGLGGQNGAGAGAGAGAGGPTAGADPGGRAAAVLEVTDHGPGLTREQAEHAFERFYRADAARTSAGTGLGLAIVAALVAAHGGVVWVQSQPGEGASFRIALPLAPEALIDDPDADPALGAQGPGGAGGPGGPGGPGGL